MQTHRDRAFKYTDRADDVSPPFARCPGDSAVQSVMEPQGQYRVLGKTRNTVLPPRQEKRVLVRSRECGRFVVTLAVTSYRNLNVTSKCQRSLRDIAANDNKKKKKKNPGGFNKNVDPGASKRKANLSAVHPECHMRRRAAPYTPCASACLCVCVCARGCATRLRFDADSPPHRQSLLSAGSGLKLPELAAIAHVCLSVSARV